MLFVCFTGKKARSVGSRNSEKARNSGKKSVEVTGKTTTSDTEAEKDASATERTNTQNTKSQIFFTLFEFFYFLFEFFLIFCLFGFALKFLDCTHSSF